MGNNLRGRLETKRQAASEPLRPPGVPTKINGRKLPLFPPVYRLSIEFDERLQLEPIAWDSKLPRQKGQYRTLVKVPVHKQAWVNLKYHLHAYTQLQNIERQEVTRRLWLAARGIFFFAMALIST